MARTNDVWETGAGGTYIQTIGSPNGYDILINGTNHYLNFNVTVGSSGYGFRDNAGIMEFKNSGGAWTGVGAGGGAGGDVVGPVSSTDGQAAVFDGATGKIIKSFVPTLGSVLFAGTAGILAQDNTNFFWDNTNKQLRLGGVSGFSATTNTPLSITGTANTYFQTYLQNSNTGNNASTDFIAGADNDGVALTGHFIDMGIQGSGNSGGTLFTRLGINDGYLYVSGGNLDIGTDGGVAGKVINFFTGGTLIANTRATITNTGLGIGTTTPLGKLDVSGSDTTTTLNTFVGARALSIINTNTTNNNASVLAFRTNDASSVVTTGAKIAGVFTSHTASAVSGDLAFLTMNAGTIGERMRILSGGNVGIGTTGPTVKLEVNGTIGIYAPSGTNRNVGFTATSPVDNFGLMAVYPTSGTNVSSALAISPKGIGNGGGYTGVLNVYNTDQVADSANYEGVSLRGLGTSGYGLFSFKVGTGTVRPIYLAADSSTSQLVLATTGNVGIGTANPVTNFVVSAGTGAAQTNLEVSMSSGATIQSYNRNTSAYSSLNIDANAINFRPNGSTAMTVAAGGLIGLGTASPAAKLDIADTTLSGSGSLAGSLINGTQTWNTSGTPTAIKLNVTDTASNAVSLLMDLQVGGVSKFSMNKSGTSTMAGNLTLGAGLAVGSSNTVSWLAGSSYLFGNATTGALTGTMRLVAGGGTSALNFGGDSSSFPAIKRSGTTLAFRLADDSADAAISTAAITSTGIHTLPAGTAGAPSINFGSATTGFYADASGHIGVASGGNLTMAFEGNQGLTFAPTYGLGWAASGVTTAESRLYRSATNVLTLSGASLIFSADATYNIGASAATRPLDIFTARHINAEGSASQITSGSSMYTGRVTATGVLGHWTRGVFSWSSDGVITLFNNANTDFGRLQFGGTTSSFPSIKRSTTTLAFRLADDSADAGISASTTAFSGLMTNVGGSGQTTLVAGTKAITVTGVTTNSLAFVQLVTPSGVTLTTSYQAVCTADTITIQANVAAGTINTADGSVLNYWVIAK